MNIRLLRVLDIALLNARVDFSQAAKAVVTTADFRPIDQAVSAASHSFFLARHLGIPTFEFSGSLRHKPVPARFASYARPSQRAGFDEPVSFCVQGVLIDDYSILFFQPRATSTPNGRPNLWGIAPGVDKLVYFRGIPLAYAQALSGDAIVKAFCCLESDALSEVSRPGSPNNAAPRI